MKPWRDRAHTQTELADRLLDFLCIEHILYVFKVQFLTAR